MSCDERGAPNIYSCALEADVQYYCLPYYTTRLHKVQQITRCKRTATGHEQAAEANPAPSRYAQIPKIAIVLVLLLLLLVPLVKTTEERKGTSAEH